MSQSELPADVEALLGGFENKVYALVGETVGKQRTFEQFLVLMSNVVDTTEGLAAQLNQMFPVERPLACGAGCGHCCSGFDVITYPYYAIFALYYAKVNNGGDAFDHAVSQIQQDSKKCFLLKDESCSIYPARPSVCRVIHSYDLNKCLAGELTNSGRVMVYAYTFAEQGLAKGFQKLGIDSNLLYFNKLIKAMMIEQNVIERWLAGETVLEPCHFLNT